MYIIGTPNAERQTKGKKPLLQFSAESVVLNVRNIVKVEEGNIVAHDRHVAIGEQVRTGLFAVFGGPPSPVRFIVLASRSQTIAAALPLGPGSKPFRTNLPSNLIRADHRSLSGTPT